MENIDIIPLVMAVGLDLEKMGKLIGVNKMEHIKLIIDSTKYMQMWIVPSG